MPKTIGLEAVRARGCSDARMPVALKRPVFEPTGCSRGARLASTRQPALAC